MSKTEYKALCKKMSSSFRAARKKLNISQEQMAELLDISSRAYEYLEHGEYLCSTPVFLRFLLHSGVNTTELLEELDEILTTE